MDNFNIRELEIASLQATGKEGLPFWTIVHFFEKTISNHMKLTTIHKICELSTQGVPEHHFTIATNSIGIYKEDIKFESFKDYETLESTNSDSQAFWNMIINLKRPIVFFDNGTERVPLYRFDSNEALRINSFTENSPFNVNFEGAAGALLDLFYAPEREERQRNEHLNQYLGQATENIERIVRTSHIIEDPRTPPGIRLYAQQSMERLMKAQESLNEKAGIYNIHINEKR